MREHLGFLKTSSTAVKIAAWVFLFLGLIGGVSIIFQIVPGYSRWVGAVALVLYTFFFFLFFLIAKIADLLIKIITVIGGSSSGGNEIKKE